MFNRKFYVFINLKTKAIIHVENIHLKNYLKTLDCSEIFI